MLTLTYCPAYSPEVRIKSLHNPNHTSLLPGRNPPTRMPGSSHTGAITLHHVCITLRALAPLLALFPLRYPLLLSSKILLLLQGRTPLSSPLYKSSSYPEVIIPFAEFLQHFVHQHISDNTYGFVVTANDWNAVSSGE